MTKLPGNCYSMLSLYDVEKAVGHRIAGKTVFIVGLPDKTIGRLTYVNCRYGVASTAAKSSPPIEINVALYKTPATAQRRYENTIRDYVANGATSTEVTVSGQPAAILTGGIGAAYRVPLLVAAAGQRTVAVSLNDTSVAPADRTRILTALGTLALTNSEG